MCKRHYSQWQRKGADRPKCSVDNCDRPAITYGWCSNHYYRWREHGDPAIVLKPYGRRPPNWASEYRYKTAGGYVRRYFPEHPNATKAGLVMEHTMVMSQQIGRGLSQDESVHHKNGVRDDNRIENLELWSRSHPAGQRLSDKIAWAKELLRRYEPMAFGVAHRDVIEVTSEDG